MIDYIFYSIIGWIGIFIVIGKLFKRPHMKIAQMTHYTKPIASLINHKYGAINLFYKYVLNCITYNIIILL